MSEADFSEDGGISEDETPVLLRHGSHIMTVLQMLSDAIKCGNVEKVKEYWSEFVEARAEYKEVLPKCVCLAATNKKREVPENSRREVLEFFLDQGADIERPDPQDYRWNYRPLHLTAVERDVPLARLLLERGAYVDSQDSEQNTALHWAATYGFTDICTLLLDHGANPNAIQQQGFTPLHDAACLGQVEATRVLLEHGANPNISDKEGWTPVHTASCYGHSEILVQLVKAGADVNRKNDNSEMAVHLAAINEHLPCLSVLTIRGADLSQQDNKGLTPFFVAVVLGRLEVMQFLLVVGADTTTPNFQQLSPLKYAMRLGDADAVRLMLKAGYNVHGETWLLNLNSTSSMMRQYQGNEEMMELLKEVIYLNRNPSTLQSLCLVRLRQLLGRHIHVSVELLPLPQSCKAKLVLTNT